MLSSLSSEALRVDDSGGGPVEPQGRHNDEEADTCILVKKVSQEA